MISIQITDLKYFMNILLLKEAFDSFYLEEATIKTAQTFHIDGHINHDFYTKEELEELPAKAEELSSFKELRPIIFSLIKGNHTPLFFKFVLHASSPYVKKLVAKNELELEGDKLPSLLLNIKYDGSKLICTTGTFFSTFTLDKTVEKLWDSTLKSSFGMLSIPFEEL